MDIEFQGDFIQKLNRINKAAFLNRCIGQVGVIAVNFSKERFVQKNWINRTREPWQPRKRPARGSILVRSARLKRSIRKISQGSYYVYIGTDVPYAQIHNEGGQINKTVNVKAFTRQTSGNRTRSRRGTQNVRAHTRRMNIRMPKRQFLGDSAVLNRRIERFISRELDNEINRQ
ncbi:phage virion morphogenesis protein [Chryseobacterium arthrosphaerae]|uniref:Phage virion morphogenesis protein n=1 Tax=Chryseobacterium arthrosphaerae TaxID=651561 RepID=A0ABU7R2X5_9FLAO